MKLYFVRHAESKDNKAGVHQRASTPLSADGVKEAKQLARRFKNLGIQLILTSPLKRAKQTAEIINVEVQKPIKVIEDLKEEKRPSEIEGGKRNDPKVMAIKEEFFRNYHDPSFRHSDGDTFVILKKRALKFLNYVQSLKDEVILVVGHGNHFRMVVGLMIFGDKLTSKEYLSIRWFFLTDTAGLSLMEYDQKGQWRLIIWNEMR